MITKRPGDMLSRSLYKMSINRMNEFRNFETNSKIVEWDLKRAGINLCKQFQLLSKDKIEELEKLPKGDCDVAIGKLQRKDSNFSKKLEQAFTDIIHRFLEANQIDIELDILSIKRDACFVINKHVKEFRFGDFLEFRPKHTYHAYIYLKPFEFYFGREDSIEVKNFVSDKILRDSLIELHLEGILNFLLNVIYIAEKSNMNYKEIYRFLQDFVYEYKRRVLEFAYYREFTIDSKFRFQSLGCEVMMDHVDETAFEYVNIEYNYIHIILPLINLLI